MKAWKKASKEDRMYFILGVLYYTFMLATLILALLTQELWVVIWFVPIDGALTGAMLMLNWHWRIQDDKHK